MESSVLIVRNLAAYSLQLAVLLGVGATAARLARLRDPEVSMRYWQGLFWAAISLPLLQWLPGLGVAQAAGVGVVRVWFDEVTLAGSPAAAGVSSATWVLLLVVAGIFARSLWFAVGLVALREYVRSGKALPSQLEIVEEMQRRVGTNARFLVSPRIRQPLTFGWRRPVVLLPSRFLHAPAHEQGSILCHELLHVRRGDWPRSLFEEVVRVVLWFHPGAWYLLGRIDLVREQVIDREVLRLTGDRRAYLELLLSYSSSQAHPTLAAARPFLRTSHLRERVHALLAAPAASRRRLVATALGALLLACGAAAMTAWAVPLEKAAPLETTMPLERASAIGSVGSPLQVGGEVEPPRKLFAEPPSYTQRARKNRVQGVVILRATIDSTGRVAAVEPLQELPDGLTEVAIDAVRGWTFEPARLRGRPVSVYYNLTINYRLE